MPDDDSDPPADRTGSDDDRETDEFDDIDVDIDDGDEKVQVCGYVERRTRELAKHNTDHGELSREIAETVKRIAYGEAAADRAQIKRELEQTRDMEDAIRGDIREQQAKLDRLQRKEARLEERLTEMTDQEERYEGHLESLEGQLADGNHVFPSHGGVKRAAAAHDEKSETTVIADLKERNPTIPAHAFQPYHETGERWDGVGDDDGDDDE